MKPILVGQFFKEFISGRKKPIGWTIVFVESRMHREPDGKIHQGPTVIAVIRNDIRVAVPIVRQYREIEDLVNSGTWIGTNAPLKTDSLIPNEVQLSLAPR